MSAGQINFLITLVHQTVVIMSLFLSFLNLIFIYLAAWIFCCLEPNPSVLCNMSGCGVTSLFMCTDPRWSTVRAAPRVNHS